MNMLRTFSIVMVFSSVGIALNKSPNNVSSSSSTDKTDYIEEEYIHCSCNLPECITKNYICLSEHSRGCYTLDAPSPHNITYGCLDTYSEIDVCSGNVPKNLSLGGKFDCCYEDMCNNEQERELGQKYRNNASLVTGDSNKQPPNADEDEINKEDNWNGLCGWRRLAGIFLPSICALSIFMCCVYTARLFQRIKHGQTVRRNNARRRNIASPIASKEVAGEASNSKKDDDAQLTYFLPSTFASDVENAPFANDSALANNGTTSFEYECETLLRGPTMNSEKAK